MILLPAIDLKDGKCVRLYQGDYSTAEVVAPDPVSTARRFQEQGAHWIHMVDLDGAKDGKPKNTDSILQVLQNTDVHIQVGGGIRTRETVERYLEQGVSRVVLGSVALRAGSGKGLWEKDRRGDRCPGRKSCRRGLDGAKRNWISGACQAHGGRGRFLYHLY